MVDDEMPQLMICKQIKLEKQALSLPCLGISKLNLLIFFKKIWQRYQKPVDNP